MSEGLDLGLFEEAIGPAHYVFREAKEVFLPNRETTCGSCSAIGHTSRSKLCPNYRQRSEIAGPSKKSRKGSVERSERSPKKVDEKKKSNSNHDRKDPRKRQPIQDFGRHPVSRRYDSSTSNRDNYHDKNRRSRYLCRGSLTRLVS
uniref:Zinc knuckle domain-containing protein n=1 Tax=Ditylenchus dipsaci TaxID=166011 RepID=A0A915EC83_9BILA